MGGNIMSSMLNVPWFLQFLIELLQSWTIDYNQGNARQKWIKGTWDLKSTHSNDIDWHCLLISLPCAREISTFVRLSYATMLIFFKNIYPSLLCVCVCTVEITMRVPYIHRHCQLKLNIVDLHEAIATSSLAGERPCFIYWQMAKAESKGRKMGKIFALDSTVFCCCTLNHGNFIPFCICFMNKNIVIGSQIRKKKKIMGKNREEKSENPILVFVWIWNGAYTLYILFMYDKTNNKLIR